MLTFIVMPMREIMRNWRFVFQQVKKTKKPVIILRNNEPQAALVDLDMLEHFNLEKARMEALEESKRRKTKIIDTPEKLAKDLKTLEYYVGN